MLMRFSTFFSAALLLTILVFNGCKDHDDPSPVNDEELITTVTLRFTKISGPIPSEPISFSWIDEDGAGSATPQIDEIAIEAHSTYRVEVSLLNESKDPVVNIGDEVKEEATDHQFFFVADGAQITSQYNDVDENGKPLGMEITLTTDHESSGTFTVILRHQPDKTGEGVANGNPANAGGDTDIEATFPVTIIE